MKKLISFTLIILIIGGCCEQYRIDEIPLRQLVKKSEESSSFSGGFFLVGGAASGETSTGTHIEMFGLHDGGYRYFKVPIEAVIIRIDDTIETPYMSITYIYGVELELDRIISTEPHLYRTKYIIACPEKYLPERLLPIEL